MSDASNYKADEKCFHYYARLETWTREEAAALLLKLDPRIVLGRDSISRQSTADTLPPYRDLLEMINRARSGLPYERPLKPELFISWAREVGFIPPQQLVDAIKKIRGTKLSHSDLYSELDRESKRQTKSSINASSEVENLHHKTKASLLKLIAGMAIRGYGYDPSSNHNSAVSDIETDLQLLNIPVSDDTIRKWIGEACELIDWETVGDDVKPPKS